MGGAIGLSASAGFILSATGTATLYLLFGAAGASFAGFKMSKNVSSNVRDFCFCSLNDSKISGLNVVIAINGWIEDDNDDDDNDKNEELEYWQRIFVENGHINLRSDCYSLQFENECRLKLGQGLKKFVARRAVSGTVSSVTKATLMTTAVGTLLAALTWPVALLAVALIS